MEPHTHSFIRLDGKTFRVPDIPEYMPKDTMKKPEKKDNRSKPKDKKVEKTTQDKDVKAICHNIIENNHGEKSDSDWGSDDDQDIYNMFMNNPDKEEEKVEENNKPISKQEQEHIEKTESQIECCVLDQLVKNDSEYSQKMQKDYMADPYAKRELEKAGASKNDVKEFTENVQKINNPGYVYNVEPEKITKMDTAGPKGEISKNKDSGNQEDSIKYTHFIHFPFYNNRTFMKKCDTFRHKLDDEEPRYAPWLRNTKYHMTIIVLQLDDDQVPLVESILESMGPILKDIMRGNCSNKNKPLKIDCLGIRHFPWKGDKNQTRDMVKPAKVGYIEMNTYDDSFESVKITCDMLIKNLIDIGIVNENNLSHISKDIQQGNVYTIDKPHITLLKNTKSKMGFDMDPIYKSFIKFKFGQVEFESMMLSKMDENYTPIATIPQ